MFSISNFKLSPPQVLVAGFAVVILIGAFILMLPAATLDGQGLSLIDALFTATSAVCVTGLVVVDTATTFTVFGQTVILLLIQVGGLGFMTFGTFFAVLVGKRIHFKERMILQEALNQNSVSGIIRMVRYIAVTTVLVEVLGAGLLAVRLLREMAPGKAVYYGVFHAISAFNNAGFDLFGNFRSLTAYPADYYVNLVMATLIIVGGLGFAVSLDLLHHRRFSSLSLHSKVVLTTTAVLLTVGTVLVYVLEYRNPQTLGALEGGHRLLAAFFLSVTARTAGFNTVNTAVLQIPTLLIIIMLMFVGASPGSTGGGIKTSTFSTLIFGVRSILTGREEVDAFGRRMGLQVVQKAIAISFISLALVLISTFFLTIFEGTDFLPALFEATSAFGTVGLSMGATAELALAGKIIIILTMFSGRLGPLTLAMALASRPKTKAIRYPEDKILVG